MVEHLVCNQAVVGSNPVASTPPSGDLMNEWNVPNNPFSTRRGFFENKVNRIKRGHHD